LQDSKKIAIRYEAADVFHRGISAEVGKNTALIVSLAKDDVTKNDN
jgi:hypothetical protein